MAAEKQAAKKVETKQAEGPNADEQGWTGSKLVALGVVTLAAAFTVLYLISPNGNP